jgi:hypothetical protein
MEEFVSPYVNHIGSCTHPNGTVFLLVTHKVGNGQFNAEIYRDDPPHATKPALIHTFVFGGPAGFGTLECLPDGSLFVAIGAGLQTTEHVGGNRQIIPNMAQPWTVQGDVILLPLVPQSSGTDTLARSQAEAALEVARNAQAAAVAATRTAEKARADAQAGATAVNKLGIPSQQDIKDIAWSLSGDRINHEVATESALVQRIEALSQERLLTAIEFALTHTAAQSRLRRLIEEVCVASVTEAIKKAASAPS